MFSFTSKNETARSICYVQNYNQVPILTQDAPSTSNNLEKVKLEKARNKLRNTKKREKRLRETVSSLTDQLQECAEIKKEILAKLEVYQGKFSNVSMIVLFRWFLKEVVLF